MINDSPTLALLYDETIEDVQYTALTIQISTLLHDRLSLACRNTDLSVETFLNFAILRALVDYESYSNLKAFHV